jgi:hypothetical protein
MRLKKAKATYETNRVLFSVMTNRAFFCPRVKVLEDGVRLVVGKKYDVTADLQPYLLKKHRSGSVVISGGKKAKS